MDCPIPGARGTLKADGEGSAGVMLLGEAMGDEEVKDSLPFRPSGQAGSVLERAIRKIGTRREMYSVWNALPCQPPFNKIDKKWLSSAIEWGRESLEEQIDRFKPRCIVALGNTAIRAATGLSGDKLTVSHLAGYVLPGAKSYYPPVVASFHPAYLRRGKMSHMGVLMRTLLIALEVARDSASASTPPYDNPPTGYILAPTEAQALDFSYQVEHQPPEGYLAYDIETYYSTNEEDAEEHDDKAIKSIQFSLAPGTGIFMPWHDSFTEIAKRILSLEGRKVGWNNWRFDDPALRAAGVRICGKIHDLMWMWHHYQPDLPRGLQFACAMQGPEVWRPTHRWPWPWKNLDKVSPAFYGIVDVDCLQWLLTYN
jgi:uracil-DNA glycosylase family 4